LEGWLFEVNGEPGVQKPWAQAAIRTVIQMAQSAIRTSYTKRANFSKFIKKASNTTLFGALSKQ
jgi:hypothetical protein